MAFGFAETIKGFPNCLENDCFTQIENVKLSLNDGSWNDTCVCGM